MYDEYIPPVEMNYYLESIKCAEEKALKTKLLHTFYDARRYFRNEFPSVWPIVMIRYEPEIFAGVTYDRIYLNTGIIDHWISTKYSEPRLFFPNEICRLIEPDHVAATGAMWAIGHEWVHIARKHNEVEEKIGKSVLNDQAFEFDADLYSIAMVYRTIQRYWGNALSDNDIIKVCLYMVFWTIRTLPNPEKESNYLPIEVRLYYIFGKLLDINSHEPRIPAEESEFIQELTELIFKLEDSLISLDEKFQEYNLRARWNEMLKSKNYLEPVKKWHEIEKAVVEISTDPLAGKFTIIDNNVESIMKALENL